MEPDGLRYTCESARVLITTSALTLPTCEPFVASLRRLEPTYVDLTGRAEFPRSACNLPSRDGAAIGAPHRSLSLWLRTPSPRSRFQFHRRAAARGRHPHQVWVYVTAGGPFPWTFAIARRAMSRRAGKCQQPQASAGAAEPELGRRDGGYARVFRPAGVRTSASGRWVLPMADGSTPQIVCASAAAARALRTGFSYSHFAALRTRSCGGDGGAGIGSFVAVPNCLLSSAASEASFDPLLSGGALAAAAGESLGFRLRVRRRGRRGRHIETQVDTEAIRARERRRCSPSRPCAWRSNKLPALPGMVTSAAAKWARALRSGSWPTVNRLLDHGVV